MMRRSKTLVIAYILLSLAGVGAAGVAWHTRVYLDAERRRIDAEKEVLVDLTRESSLRITDFLRLAIDAADSLANDLSTGAISREELLDRLQANILSHPSFYGGTIAFVPNSYGIYGPEDYEPSDSLYAPYYAWKDGKLEFLRIETEYDYTAHDWYAVPIAERRSSWSAPYFDEGVGDIFMTTYSAVFYRREEASGEKVPWGVVTIDLSMDTINQIVRSLNLDMVGYGVLVSGGGHYLYHPISRYVRDQRPIEDLAREALDEDMIALWEWILDGGDLAEYIRSLNVSSYLYIPQKVQLTDWHLIGIVNPADISDDHDNRRRQLMKICCFGLIGLSALVAFGLRGFRGDTRSLWWAASCISILAMLGIGYLWRVTLMHDADLEENGIPITNVRTLQKQQRSYVDKAHRQLISPPVFLPTGIFVHSLRFINANNIMVAGYVWQRIDTTHVDGSLRQGGFIFPEATDLDIGEPISEFDGPVEIKRWPFQAALGVQFNYAKYPLVQQRLSVRLSPKVIDQPVMLVPDLDAYPYTSPTQKPGLGDGIVLAGWNVMRTYFAFYLQDTHSDWRLQNSMTQGNFPDIYYRIEIKKRFADAFLSNLTPLIIALLMAFSVVFISTRDPELVSFMRTGTGFTLSFCATLLFVVVFLHIGLRQKIQAERFFYLEIFYFVLYLNLLFVCINSILVTFAPQIHLIRYEDNFVAKVLYLPVTMFVLFVATLITFY